MSTITAISTPNAPAAIGPYQQAIKANGFVFVSGCIPLEASTGHIVEGGFEAQVKQVLRNMTAILEASGSSLDKVVKTTVFLKSMDNFGILNDVYGRVFSEHKAARAAVEVSRLPKDVLVEIDCIAVAA